MASRNCHLEIIQLLLDSTKGDENLKVNLLHEACHTGNLEVVRILLDNIKGRDQFSIAYTIFNIFELNLRKKSTKHQF